MIIPQTGVHEVRAPSIGAGQHVNVIIYSSGQSSAVPRAGIHAGGPDVVESDVVFVSHRRGVRSHDRQGVLAVLQQGTPVNDAKHSTEVRWMVKDYMSVA